MNAVRQFLTGKPFVLASIGLVVLPAAMHLMGLSTDTASTVVVLAIAPLVAPFGGLVPQTRVRIRTTGSASYGRHIPSYPEEWGGGVTLPNNRDLRVATLNVERARALYGIRRAELLPVVSTA